MFFSTEILTTKKSGFSVVWIAATLGTKNQSKRLSKRDFLGVDVVKTCEMLRNPPAPLALRLTSNLMYGLIKVYHQQFVYFSGDVNQIWQRLNHSIDSLWNEENITMPVKQARFDAITLPPLDMISDNSFTGNLSFGLNFPQSQGLLPGSPSITLTPVVQPGASFSLQTNDDFGVETGDIYPLNRIGNSEVEPTDTSGFDGGFDIGMDDTTVGGSHYGLDLRPGSPLVTQSKVKSFGPMERVGSHFGEEDLTQAPAASPRKRGKKRARLVIDKELEISREAFAQGLQDYEDLLGDAPAMPLHKELLASFFKPAWLLPSADIARFWTLCAGVDEDELQKKRVRLSEEDGSQPSDEIDYGVGYDTGFDFGGDETEDPAELGRHAPWHPQHEDSVDSTDLHHSGINPQLETPDKRLRRNSSWTSLDLDVGPSDSDFTDNLNHALSASTPGETIKNAGTPRSMSTSKSFSKLIGSASLPESITTSQFERETANFLSYVKEVAQNQEYVLFEEVVPKALSRSAAAEGFFHILVLTSRGAIKSDQSSPFAEIQLTPV